MAPRDCWCGLMTYRHAVFLVGIAGVLLAIRYLEVVLDIFDTYEDAGLLFLFRQGGLGLCTLATYVPVVIGAFLANHQSLSTTVLVNFIVLMIKSLLMWMLYVLHLSEPSLRPPRLAIYSALFDWFAWYLTYQYLRYLLEQRSGRRHYLLVREQEGEDLAHVLDVPEEVVGEIGICAWELMAALDEKLTSMMDFDWLFSLVDMWYNSLRGR